jgi:hypothetical protein
VRKESSAKPSEFSSKEDREEDDIQIEVEELEKIELEVKLDDLPEQSPIAKAEARERRRSTLSRLLVKYDNEDDENLTSPEVDDIFYDAPMLQNYLRGELEKN